MTSEETLRSIPGGQALFDWFGRVPHFHDANVLEISLASKGPSMVRFHTWHMTDKLDDKGYFILEKHIVVTLILDEVTHVDLHDFDLPGIVGFLDITRTEDGYQFAWDVSYGVGGSLRAKQARIELSPGEP